MFHVKHSFYIIGCPMDYYLYLNTVAFRNTFFNLAVIEHTHLYGIGAFRPHAYYYLAGVKPNIGNCAYNFNLPHIFARAVQLAGVKALYGLRVDVSYDFQLTQAKLVNAQICVIHYNCADYHS